MPNPYMNALQAASNAAAGNISGPVDGLAWLLRKAGVPVPNNALLSSQWMAERGLTAPVQPGASQMVGETLGLSAPIAAAAKAPEIARGLLRAGENLLAPATVNRGAATGQRGVLAMQPDGAARMATAQRNAAKPVSEGGLGLGPNNTAAERAQAMGFTTEGYRGSSVDEVIPRESTWWSSRPDLANMYAASLERPTPANYSGNVTPLLVNTDNLKPFGGTNFAGIPTSEQMTLVRSGTRDKAGKVISGFRDSPAMRDKAGNVYPEVKFWEALSPSSSVRSRFAAFDPARRNEADILGRADPNLLWLLGLGAGGAAYLGSEK